MILVLSLLSCIFFKNTTKQSGAKTFQRENLIKALSGDMILPKFGEYTYNHEAGRKPELIPFWVRDIVDIYKSENQILIDSSDIDINEMNRIDIVVGGDHRQGDFFPMKILNIMNSGKSHKSIQPVDYILCTHTNSLILKVQLSRILETRLIC